MFEPCAGGSWMTNSLTVSIDPTGSSAVMRPVGEVDWGTAALLRAAFDRAVSDAVVDTLLVDLSGTTFMDCAGLTVLLQARRHWGKGLRLYRPPASLRRILHALEMEDTFTVVETPGPIEQRAMAVEPAPRTEPGPPSQSRSGWPQTTTPPFDEGRIRAKARELHDATDGTGCECGGTVPLEGVLSSGPWWQRGWYGIATSAIIEENRRAHVRSRGSRDGQSEDRRQAEGVVAEVLRGSGTTERQADTAGHHVVNALDDAGLLRLRHGKMDRAWATLDDEGTEGPGAERASGSG
jgi:anti-sigma B factor antagonist